MWKWDIYIANNVYVKNGFSVYLHTHKAIY